MANKKVWRWVEEADGQGGTIRRQVAEIMPLDAAGIAPADWRALFEAAAADG